MPQIVGPRLRFARPQTTHGFVTSSAKSQRHTPRVQSSPGTGRTQPSSHEEADYHIELLEYEWPDLPPIIDMKDAVTRRKVSKGIAYLLPVDKGKNSINSKFRTDLRAMFQEPYANESSGYDDNRVVRSAKVHFKTNVVDTTWTKDHARNIPVSVNSESEKFRKLYAHSAPAGGRGRSSVSIDKLQTRSSLFLPIKSKDHPEAMKLRKEVENIIKSVQEDNDEYDEDNTTDMATTEKDTAENGTKEHRKSILHFRSMSICKQDAQKPGPRVPQYTAAQFDTYEQLKQTRPPKPQIPDEFKSEFLSVEKCQEIWDWLHFGETITDFEYFLQVCG